MCVYLGTHTQQQQRKKRGHEFEREHVGGTWEDLEGRKGKGNDIIYNLKK